MAIQIAREDTGKVLSDVCAQWTGWAPTYSVATLRTVTGVRYIQSEEVSVVEHECRAKFRFASRYPRSTLDNRQELLLEAYRQAWFILTDLEGFETRVQIVEPPTSSQVSEIKHFACYEVDVVMLREGFSR